MAEVSEILDQLSQGDPRRASELLPIVYDELRRLAARRIAGEAPGHSLDASALVHEAYLRLVGTAEPRMFTDRSHFFASAADAMRRILVDRARVRNAQKRGGGRQRLDFNAL